MKKEQKSTPGLRDLLRIKEPSDRGGKKPILKKTHFTIWYFVGAIILVLLLQSYLSTRKTEEVIAYSELKELLKTGKIKELTINPESINGEEKTGRKFQAVRVEDPDLVKELEASHVKYTGKVDNKWLTNIISWIIPLVFFFILWRILFSRIGPETSVMSFGKSRAKIYAAKEKKITFAGVAGIS